MKKIYKISKWLHKWSSIIISILLIWVSISGILLNHPELIKSISVPKYLLPETYDLVNWNRSVIVQAQYSSKNEKTAYFGGNEGVFRTEDNGFTFINMTNNGFPQSAYTKRTKSIALFENEQKELLFAGTYDGLYKYDIKDDKWNKIIIPYAEDKIVKLIKNSDSIIVVTDSEILIANAYDDILKFNKIPMQRIDDNPSMTMIEFFFQLHTGEIWGISGKIIFDIAGIVLLFLSISGLYIWLSPKYRNLKTRLKLKNNKSKIGWFYRNHLKLGIWSFAILIIFAITGLFMRPPLIATLFSLENIANKYVPAPISSNPWKHRIRNAMFDNNTNQVIIDTKDGYWVSEKGIYGNYSNQFPPVPIFAMGATVLENDEYGNLLIGSFAGLFRIKNSGLYAENVIDKNEPIVSNVRPGANLITGYFKEPGAYEYVTTHFGGLLNVQHPNEKRYKYIMPKFLKENYSMSLWNYLFEIHNGRIFEFLLGEYYILISPLSALIFILVIITGVFDWLYLKLKKKNIQKRFKKK